MNVIAKSETRFGFDEGRGRSRTGYAIRTLDGKVSSLPAKNRKKLYQGACVDLGGQDINDMKDHSSCRSITRRTFLRHVDRELLWDIERNLGYDVRHDVGSRLYQTPARDESGWRLAWRAAMGTSGSGLPRWLQEARQ